MTEGQHGLLQQVGGDDLISVVVVELAELSGDALLNGKPLASRVAVQQEHLQKSAWKDGLRLERTRPPSMKIGGTTEQDHGSFGQ